MPIQRLLTHAVAGKKQSLLRLVPHSNGEHAVKMVQCFVAPLLVTVNDHFRIALGPETMAEIFQLDTQLAEIINLTIENDDYGTILVADWLSTTGDVDNGETRYGKSDAALEVIALTVRSTMSNRVIEPAQKLTVHVRRIGSQVTADTAHSLDFVLRLNAERVL